MSVAAVGRGEAITILEHTRRRRRQRPPARSRGGSSRRSRRGGRGTGSDPRSPGSGPSSGRGRDRGRSRRRQTAWVVVMSAGRGDAGLRRTSQRRAASDRRRPERRADVRLGVMSCQVGARSSSMTTSASVPSGRWYPNTGRLAHERSERWTTSPRRAVQANRSAPGPSAETAIACGRLSRCGRGLDHDAETDAAASPSRSSARADRRRVAVRRPGAARRRDAPSRRRTRRDVLDTRRTRVRTEERATSAGLQICEPHLPSVARPGRRASYAPPDGPSRPRRIARRRRDRAAMTRQASRRLRQPDVDLTAGVRTRHGDRRRLSTRNSVRSRSPAAESDPATELEMASRRRRARQRARRGRVGEPDRGAEKRAVTRSRCERAPDRCAIRFVYDLALAAQRLGIVSIPHIAHP